MKVLVQRVSAAHIYIREQELRFLGSIKQGLLVFAGIEKDDSLKDLDYLAEKVVNLRIFEDEQGKLNISAKDKGLEIMCVPNFTLAGAVDRGRRPSFDAAAGKDKGKEFFQEFCRKIKAQGVTCVEGIFGASMVIEAKNYGPVNIIISSRE